MNTCYMIGIQPVWGGNLLIWRWRCWFFYIIMCISVFGGIFLLLSKVNYPVPVLDTGPQENWRYQKILQETVCAFAIPCQARERDSSIISISNPFILYHTNTKYIANYQRTSKPLTFRPRENNKLTQVNYIFHPGQLIVSPGSKSQKVRGFELTSAYICGKQLQAFG